MKLGFELVSLRLSGYNVNC